MVRAAPRRKAPGALPPLPSRLPRTPPAHYLGIMARDDTDIEDTQGHGPPAGAGLAAPSAGTAPRRLHAVPSSASRHPPAPRPGPRPAPRPSTALPAAAASGAMEPEEVARVTLEALRQRHRDLDLAIEALQARGTDPLTVRRLKKRKLALRDRIAAIEDRLTPDIIA